MSQPDFRYLVERCQATHALLQGYAARTVDVALVARNWLFGRHIVEFEQHGADRAVYGDQLIKRLSAELKARMGKGFSERNLEQCRKFYLLFQVIPHAPSAELPALAPAIQTGAGISQTVSAEFFKNFTLGWSHYVALLTIDNPAERRFYGIEATANSWSVRELERQIASSLYERLALSRDKEEIRKLSEQGLVIEKAADLIKNPLVLEFLGLEEKPAWSENELETAIIDASKPSCWNWARGFCSRPTRNALPSTTITFTSIWSSTTDCCAAMCSST